MSFYPTSYVLDNGHQTIESSDPASVLSEDNNGRDSPFHILSELDLLVDENIEELKNLKQSLNTSSKKSSKLSHSSENQKNIFLNGFSSTSTITVNSAVVSGTELENETHQGNMTVNQVNIPAKSEVVSSSVLTDSGVNESEFITKVRSAELKHSKESFWNDFDATFNMHELKSQKAPTSTCVLNCKDRSTPRHMSLPEKNNNKCAPVNIPVPDCGWSQTPINNTVPANNKNKTWNPSNPYFEGCLDDRLSDYEDIWNTPLTTPSSFDNKKHHFLFVQNPNFELQSNSNSQDTSVVNPAFLSDEELVFSGDNTMYDSEDSKNPSLMNTDVFKTDEITVDEPIQIENTGTVIRLNKLKDNTHVFSFNFSLPPTQQDLEQDDSHSVTGPETPPPETSTGNWTTFTVITPQLGGSMCSSPSSAQPNGSHVCKVEISKTRMNSVDERSPDEEMLLRESPSPKLTTPPLIPANRCNTSPEEVPNSFNDDFKQIVMEMASLDIPTSCEPVVSSTPPSIQQKPSLSPTPHNEHMNKSSNKYSTGRCQSFCTELPNVTTVRQRDKYKSLPPTINQVYDSREKSRTSGSALSSLSMNRNSCHNNQSTKSLRSTPDCYSLIDREAATAQKSDVVRLDVFSDNTGHLVNAEQKLSESFEDDYFSVDEDPILEEDDQHESGSTKPLKFYGTGDSRPTSLSEMTAMEDMITDWSTDMTVKPIKPLTISNLQKMSGYDNIRQSFRPVSTADTEFCMPWDSSIWTNLIGMSDGPSQSLLNSFQPSPPPSPPPPNTTSLSPEFSKALQQWKENNRDINLDDTDSEADYSSAFMDNHQGEPKTVHHILDLDCDIATSFEWVRPDLMFGTSPPEYIPVRPVSVPVKASLPAYSLSSQTTAKYSPDNQTLSKARQMSDSSAQRFRGDPPSYKMDCDTVTWFSDEEHEDSMDAENLMTESFQEKLMPSLGSSRLLSLKSNKITKPVIKVMDVVNRMSLNRTTTFGNTIQNFIQCTIEGTESSPHVVMRNVRQFMNGVKNYLAKNGEKELNMLIEEERSKLESDEFLNVDSIIENALYRCVIKPLKQHISKLFVDEYSRNGNLNQLSENIKYARTKTTEEMGIKPELVPPQGTSLEAIKHFFSKMQKACSPLKKLEHLKGAISSIYNSIGGMTITKSKRGEVVSIGADDFLPIVVYVLIHSDVVAAEIEADYMWGLLHPSLLAGEGSFHLTTLSSAVHVLKNFRETYEAQPVTAQTCLPSGGDLPGFMKVLIPDEQCDSIIRKTLPVRPNMSTRDVCSMIAHKVKITNPQDYGLYQVLDGIETKLSDDQCPQKMRDKLVSSGCECFFTYKRNNAMFVWPVLLNK